MVSLKLFACVVVIIAVVELAAGGTTSSRKPAGRKTTTAPASQNKSNRAGETRSAGQMMSVFVGTPVAGKGRRRRQAEPEEANQLNGHIVFAGRSKRQTNTGNTGYGQTDIGLMRLFKRARLKPAADKTVKRRPADSSRIIIATITIAIKTLFLIYIS
ncbi:uncharacterized protein LOC129588000 [Paramacrobiotus metropolitanus]|uniref:uncharacterized protein LOC129588000 n=1 Tax=Paramacrobiotus metropolitanus TaxID=2943436 RepID=UPI002445EC6C|nr:uncharacterized protein LOC129588000 [Paramacrobiotus metropolitanus]